MQCICIMIHSAIRYDWILTICLPTAVLCYIYSTEHANFEHNMLWLPSAYDATNLYASDSYVSWLQGSMFWLLPQTEQPLHPLNSVFFCFLGASESPDITELVICGCSTGSQTAAWLTHVTSWGSYWLLSWCIRIFCVGLTPVRWVGVLVFWWNWLSQVSVICILTGGGCFMRSKTWDKQPYFVYHNTFVTLSVPCISLIWHKFIDQLLHVNVTCRYN